MKIIIQEIPMGSKPVAVWNEPEELMTGEESWPVLGNVVPAELIAESLQACQGLHAHYACDHKARVAKKILMRNGIACRMVVGSLLIVSGDHQSEYGFYFLPPYEFHAWLVLAGGNIFDIGLPGVINKGLVTSDEQGPFLVDREPVILAGKPEAWMKYGPVEVL